jgi:adenine phosphoribosyltransferase
MDLTSDLKSTMRTIPDFPKPGILFKDITPLFNDPALLERCVDAMIERFSPPADPAGFDFVGGIEARGFIFGAMIAQKTGKPFVPFRKAGKLPSKCLQESYSLEYGEATIEIHEDAIPAGKRVLLVDDLLATGGTAAAAARLVAKAGGVVSGVAFLIELDFLGGHQKLGEAGVSESNIMSLVSYADNE